MQPYEIISSIIIGINTIVIILFSFVNFYQSKQERTYNANVRWFRDFFNIKEDIKNFYEDIYKQFSKCSTDDTFSRKEVTILEELKTKMIGNTIKFFLIFDEDIYNKCSEHIELITDKLIKYIFSKEENRIIKETINNSEIELYRYIFNYDVKFKFSNKKSKKKV